MSQLLNKRRNFTLILLFIFSLLSLDQITSYLKLPPILKVIKAESYKHPFSKEFNADKALLDFLSSHPNKEDVLNSLKIGKFKSVNDNKEALSDKAEETYYSIVIMKRSYLASLFLLSYEVTIVTDYKDQKLQNLKSYIFEQGL